MRILALLLVALLLVAWSACQSVAAGEWWWAAESRSAEPPESPAKKFNPLAPIDAGVKGIDRGLKRLGSDTKRFFSTAGNALRWKRSAESSQRTARHVPWIQPAKPETEQKPSWFGSLFEREEPRPSSSVTDFLGAGRLDP